MKQGERMGGKGRRQWREEGRREREKGEGGRRGREEGKGEEENREGETDKVTREVKATKL